MEEYLEQPLKKLLEEVVEESFTGIPAIISERGHKISNFLKEPPKRTFERMSKKNLLEKHFLKKY